MIKFFFGFFLALTISIICFAIWEAETVTGAINIMSDPLAAIAGLVTFLLGYLIYRDIGIKKVIIEKQLETVLAFIDELKKANFQIATTQTGQLTHIENIYPSLDRFSTMDIQDEILASKIMIVPDKFRKQLLPIMTHLHSLYMPKQLTRRFWFFSGSFTGSNMTHFSKVIVNLEGWDDIVGWEIIGDTDDDAMTVGQFIDELRSGLIDMNSWIESFSKDLNLNV